VKYWVHTAFLNVEGQKMSKSLDNLYTIDDLKERGYSPLSLRYFLLGSSYRKSLNFTWEALDGSQRAAMKLWDMCAELPPPGGGLLKEYLDRFEDAIGDDLNTALALSILLEMIRSDSPPEQKAATAFVMDRVLGLDLQNARTRLSDAWNLQGVKPEMEMKAEQLAAQRSRMREERRFEEADRLRDEILEMGFYIEDTPGGYRVRPAFMAERDKADK
jgi:cysteinyl-tRNA synthetase